MASQLEKIIMNSDPFYAKNFRPHVHQQFFERIARRHKSRFEFGSPLIVNNLNLPQKAITDSLATPYFKDLYQLAIGKTEWADLKRNDQSIADKKQVINTVDWVFTAAASEANCEASRLSLEEADVNARLLDCSDAHARSDSTDKDRLGHCYTWIHADTEFEGLRQALREPRARVHLGQTPEQKVRVTLNGQNT